MKPYNRSLKQPFEDGVRMYVEICGVPIEATVSAPIRESRNETGRSAEPVARICAGTWSFLLVTYAPRRIDRPRW